MASKVQNVQGSAVRAWANENGVQVGARGKFSVEVIEAFNKAHKGSLRYAPGNQKEITLSVKVRSEKSGKVRSEKRAFPEAEVRKAAGESAGKRGPLSSKALEAAAAALSV